MSKGICLNCKKEWIVRSKPFKLIKDCKCGRRHQGIWGGVFK